MPDILIDAKFIDYWKKYYVEDDIGGDDEKYIEILEKVSKELSQGTITKDTFIDILRWKTTRLTGIVRLDEFSNYEVGIKEAYNALEDDQKLSILDDLYGIGVPTASTILHFMYPSDFPIMDIRVAETLLDSGYPIKTTKYLRKTKNSVRYYVSCAGNYAPFCAAIRDIANESRRTLRDVDKAIFAYHKKNYGKQGKKCKQT